MRNLQAGSYGTMRKGGKKGTMTRIEGEDDDLYGGGRRGAKR